MCNTILGFKGIVVSEIQSLARGLQIIDILETSGDGITVTEVAEKLGLDKSSVSRFMKTLANYGYAEQNPKSRRYQLGPRVISLSQSLLGRISLREQATPFLRKMVDRTGECAHLAILSKNRALYIHQVDTSASLRVSAGIGTMAPLHCTALGKVLLAFDNVDLPEVLDSYTPRTITDSEILKLHIEQTRRQGYGTDDEEYTLGVRCVAAPVYDVNGELACAMGISGPAGRLTLERIPELGQTIVAIGQELTKRLRFE